MHFSRTILFALVAPSAVLGLAIDADLVERTPSKTAKAAGSTCKTVGGAVGVAVVCKDANGAITIDGKPADAEQSKAAQADFHKREPTPAAAAAAAECTTVAGAVGASVVCRHANGAITIDGEPATPEQSKAAKNDFNKRTPSKAAAPGAKCTTVAGAVSNAVVCKEANGAITIDGEPATPEQSKAAKNDFN